MKVHKPFKFDIPKCVYWKVITLYIGYIKKCLLTEKVPIEWKCIYWPKMWLLNENVHIDQKMCILNENAPINWKCICWMKKCLLTENVSIEKWKGTNV